MILTRRSGALRARRDFTDTPVVSDERELRTAELMDRTTRAPGTADQQAA